MTSTNDLSTRWSDLLGESRPVQQEVDAGHPLSLIFGLDESLRPLFAVRLAFKPAEPDLPKDVVDCVVGRRNDGRYVLRLSLKDQTLFDVFVRLCSDLAARSRGATGEVAALREIYAALAEWKRLLLARPDHMSLEALRGLVGELWVGWAQLADERPIEEVFTHWKGPFGAHQDFQFGDELVEVKAVRPGVGWVQIASEYQLESEGRPLSLIVVELQDAAAESKDSVSLPGLVAQVRQELALTPLAAQAFETALRELDTPLTHSFYAESWFTIRRSAEYTVAEGFPRIARESLARGVGDVSYRLDLAALATFARLD